MTQRAVLTRGVVLIAGMAVIAGLHAAADWAQTLSQQALDSGFLSRLPPTVSVALGFAKGEEGAEVRQLLSKDGQKVRTFNVCTANHADIVIFDVNAHTGATVAYLLTADGQLRKAVSYQAGHEARELPAAEAKAGLSREQHFWSARAAKSPAAAARAPATAAPTAATPK